MQQPDYSAKTIGIFHERNVLVLFILSVMHGGYNMNIRCNQKFVFYEDSGSIDFSVFVQRIHVISELSTLGDFHFTARYFWDSHFTALWTEKGRFPTLQPLLKSKLSVQASQKI